MTELAFEQRRSLVKGRMVRLIACVFGALAVSLPARALACACCDAPASMKAAGWSADGQTVLLDYHELVGCEDMRRRRALRRGDQSSACSVRKHDPPEYSCGKPIRGHVASLSPADYPGEVRAVRAGHLRASVRVLERRYPTLRAVNVQVFAGGRWHPLYSGRFFGWHPGEADTPSQERLEEIAALPTPDGKQAIVSIAEFDSQPGSGAAGIHLAWVDLPESVGAAPGAASDFETLPRHDVAKAPPFDEPVVPGPGRLAIFEPGSALGESPSGPLPYNAQGLTAHRKGDFATSSRLFAEAVCADSSNPFPRYNLACAYARLNMPELAMAQLSIIAEQRKCARCGERLARARTDEDLASLRERADFRALVCGDAGNCLLAPEAEPVASAVPAPPSAAASALPPGKPVSVRRPACRCDVSSRGAPVQAIAAATAVLAAFRMRRRR